MKGNDQEAELKAEIAAALLTAPEREQFLTLQRQSMQAHVALDLAGVRHGSLRERIVGLRETVAREHPAIFAVLAGAGAPTTKGMLEQIGWLISNRQQVEDRLTSMSAEVVRYHGWAQRLYAGIEVLLREESVQAERYVSEPTRLSVLLMRLEVLKALEPGEVPVRNPRLRRSREERYEWLVSKLERLYSEGVDVAPGEISQLIQSSREFIEDEDAFLQSGNLVSNVELQQAHDYVHWMDQHSGEIQ